MKNCLYILMTFCAMTLMSCSNSTNEEYATQEPAPKSSSIDNEDYTPQERSSSSTQSSSSNNSTSDFVGTYKFQDFEGKKWKLVLSSDESAVISLNGEEIDWGEWRSSLHDEYCTVEFSWEFGSDAPEIAFETSKDRYYYIHIKNGYIYTDLTKCKGNHPKARLKYNFSK